MAKISKQPDGRRQAIKALQAVIQNGESLSTALPQYSTDLHNAQERAFMQMLVYGVLRNYWRLKALLALMLVKPLKVKDHDIELVLMMALFQLMDTRVPDYASVDASVNLVRSLGKSKAWATGLVNAVLRNFIREQDDWLKKLDAKPQAVHRHPQWMIDRLRKDWPEQWTSILQANNEQAPMTLRINRQRISVEDYQQKLGAEAQSFDQALVLEQATDVHELPGFEDGWFSVQDAAAQKAAPLLDIAAGQRVLDCCAAPGGKTCHVLELEPDIEMLAMDISEQRLSRIQENLERLGLSAELVAGDASSPTDWWDSRPFDRVLLDVPCSASGVIRRHPDIKILRRPNDIAQLVTIQQQILTAIWPLLKPGGKLLYVTCSVFKAENEQQIASFLTQEPDVEELPIDADWGLPRPHGRQILPGQDNMDGFYYCLLHKTM